MKHFLIYLFGAATASAWWALVVFPFLNHDGSGFLFIPIALTVASLAAAIAKALLEDQDHD